MKKKNCALVLSGGGAKGCYQIGAWRALNELGFSFDAVVGASIGTINAAAVAQDDFDMADGLWKNASIRDVIDVPEEFIVDENIKLTSKGLLQFNKFLDSYFKSGGFDTEPLRKLLEANIVEEKIRESGIDFGLITVNLSKRRSEELFLDEIPEGQLLDYIIASASFPLFKKTKIDGNVFVDGGLADNIPYEMVKNRGYKSIVVIDVSGVGKNRVPDINGTDTLYIKNSIDFGNFLNAHNVLDFSDRFIEKFTLLGYLDTMKIFSGNFGENYFIQKDKGYYKLEEILKVDVYFSRFKEVIDKKYINYKSPALILLDQAALFFQIERIKEYRFTELLRFFVFEYKRGDFGTVKKILKKDLKGCADLLYDIISNEEIFR